MAYDIQLINPFYTSIHCRYPKFPPPPPCSPFVHPNVNNIHTLLTPIYSHFFPNPSPLFVSHLLQRPLNYILSTLPPEPTSTMNMNKNAPSSVVSSTNACIEIEPSNAIEPLSTFSSPLASTISDSPVLQLSPEIPALPSTTTPLNTAIIHTAYPILPSTSFNASTVPGNANLTASPANDILMMRHFRALQNSISSANHPAPNNVYSNQAIFNNQSHVSARPPAQYHHLPLVTSYPAAHALHQLHLGQTLNGNANIRPGLQESVFPGRVPNFPISTDEIDALTPLQVPNFQHQHLQHQFPPNATIRQDGRRTTKDHGLDIESTIKKRYICYKCSPTREFKRAHNLKIHQRVHTGETPFSCVHAQCPKKFKWKSSIVSHLKWHQRQGDILPNNVQLPFTFKGSEDIYSQNIGANEAPVIEPVSNPDNSNGGALAYNLHVGDSAGSASRTPVGRTSQNVSVFATPVLSSHMVGYASSPSDGLAKRAIPANAISISGGPNENSIPFFSHGIIQQPRGHSHHRDVNDFGLGLGKNAAQPVPVFRPPVLPPQQNFLADIAQLPKSNLGNDDSHHQARDHTDVIENKTEETLIKAHILEKSPTGKKMV